MTTDKTPETSPAAEHDRKPVTNRLSPHVGRTPKPTFTQTGDWVWMHQGLSDRGFRYYCAVRAYIFDKDDLFEVDLTDEVIAHLLGKTRKSVSAARRDCYEAGVIEELHTWRESVQVPGKNRPEVRTFRRLIVHHEVPANWPGPINAYDEKRTIEASRAEAMKAKRAEREQASVSAGQCDEKVSSGHIDQGKHDDGHEGASEANAVTSTNDKTAGQCDGKVSSNSWEISSRAEEISSSDTRSDQAKQVPYLPIHLPVHLPIHPSRDADAREAGDSGDGWMDGEHSSNNNHDQQEAPAQESEGALLLAKVERAVGGYVQAGRSRHIAAIDAALEVLPARQVEAHLGDNVRDARNPGGVVVTRIGQLDELAATRRAEVERAEESRRRAQQRHTSSGFGSVETSPLPEGDHSGGDSRPVSERMSLRNVQVPASDDHRARMRAEIDSVIRTRPKEVTQGQVRRSNALKK